MQKSNLQNGKAKTKQKQKNSEREKKREAAKSTEQQDKRIKSHAVVT